MLIFILGCMSEEDSSKTQPTITTEYYTAQSLITLYSGVEFEESYIVQRVVDHQNASIEENFISTIDGTSIFVNIQADIATQTFELSFSDDSYIGEGTFEGEGMMWTSWQSVSNHLDGSYVLSSDLKEGDDIKTQKEGYDEDDVLQWTLNEHLQSISEEEYEQELSTLP